ncbi:MAG: glycosyltransferase family 2 protein, partial [Acidimicrobiales bacterium]
SAAVSFVPPPWQKGRLGERLWLEGAAPHDRPTDVEWVTGAVHVLRASALGGALPYDERWFMYVEDLELCWRLSRGGWRRRLEADVEVVHTGNASGAQAWGSSRSARYWEASYDWYRRDKGAAAARRWAFVNTLGASLHAGALGAGAVLGAAGARGERRTRSAELRGVLPVHVSALVGRGRGERSRGGRSGSAG